METPLAEGDGRCRLAGVLLGEYSVQPECDAASRSLLTMRSSAGCGGAAVASVGADGVLGPLEFWGITLRATDKLAPLRTTFCK